MSSTIVFLKLLWWMPGKKSLLNSFTVFRDFASVIMRNSIWCQVKIFQCSQDYGVASNIMISLISFIKYSFSPNLIVIVFIEGKVFPSSF